jgi:hypothetical protein
MNTRSKAALLTLTAANTFLAANCAYFAASILRNPGARTEPTSLLWLMALCVFLVWTGHVGALVGAYRRRTSDSITIAHTVSSQAMPALLGLMVAFLMIYWRS